MGHSFEGTTLALEHYYDVLGVSRKLPLMTVYQADEQPFGRRVAVWMGAYGAEGVPVGAQVARRLDEAMLANSRLAEFHTLRVLDYGTSEGNAFVVTEPVEAVPLRVWLRVHGPVHVWQGLRLLDQLVSVVLHAHSRGVESLCLSSESIYLVDEARFEIRVGPMGVGLSRSEILALKNVTIVPDLVRHIPPWAYRSAGNRGGALQKSPEQASSSGALPEGDVGESVVSEDGVQDVGGLAVTGDAGDAPDAFCEDLYAVAAILYEALGGAHPYFGDDSDLATAILDLVQASPIPLSERVEIPEALSEFVMGVLREPRRERLDTVVSDYARHCSASDLEKVRVSEKPWGDVEPDPTPVRRRHRRAEVMRRPWFWFAALALVLVVGVGSVTWHLARSFDPVDLFAIPEIIPASPDGVDVVFSPQAVPPGASLYLASMADGSLIRLGELPYIYRSQPRGAQLRFVVADDQGHSVQIPVTVKGNSDLMIVPVSLNGTP